MISEEQLNELERLANEATEGPWCLVPTETFGGKMLALRSEKTKDDARSGFGLCVSKSELPNYEFIAAAREAMPMLLDEVRKLQDWKKILTRYRAWAIGYITRLEKEADWLASQCVSLYGDICSEVASSDYSNDPEMNVNHWLEEARKATSND